MTLTGIERMHLENICEKYGLDPALIDPSLDYYENLRILKRYAPMDAPEFYAVRKMITEEQYERLLRQYEEAIQRGEEEKAETIRRKLEERYFAVRSRSRLKALREKYPEFRFKVIGWFPDEGKKILLVKAEPIK
ncbi:MAG: hypothetical protein QW692_02185 [Nitrososphaerota archaeon]